MGNGAICGCCKKKQLVVHAAVVHAIQETKNEDSNGVVRLYAGARTNDNHHTCPVLSIRTWTRSQEASVGIGGKLTADGSQLGRNRVNTTIENAVDRSEHHLKLNVQIRIVPIEDILSINVRSEIRKDTIKRKTIRARSAPPEDEGCCSCFSAKKVKPPPERIITEETEREATRSICMTIKHLRHSLVHTPSNITVLSADKQKEFFTNQLGIETLTFYYLSNETFDGTDFDNELQQSEALARIVMQLKAMAGQYPDPNQLKEIIQQNHSHIFGYHHSENAEISATSLIKETYTQSEMKAIE